MGRAFALYIANQVLNCRHLIRFPRASQEAIEHFWCLHKRSKQAHKQKKEVGSLVQEITPWTAVHAFHIGDSSSIFKTCILPQIITKYRVCVAHGCSPFQKKEASH